MACDVSSSRRGVTGDVHNALEYVTANKNRLGIPVANLSAGHTIYAPASQDPLPWTRSI